MILLKYTITKEDYVNFYTYVLWDAPGNRNKRLLHYTRQLIPILLFTFAFYYTGIFQRSNTFVLVILGIILLTTALSLFGVRSNTVKQGYKIADDPNNSSLFQENTLLISETGITAKDPCKELIYSWKAFIKKQENKEYFFLFTSSLQGIIIPKRIFTAAEKDQFVKLLSQQLSFDAELGHLLKS